MAAPLWAAAHAIPEGEGLAGQHGKQGYMLLLGVLTRSWLMIMGFTLALVLMPQIGPYVAMGYDVASSAMDADFATGPVAYFTELAILGGLMITLVHKVFGMVTHLDDNVLKWIGGAQSSLGEGQDEQRVRQTAGAFYGRVDSAAVSTARGMVKSNNPNATPSTTGNEETPGGGGNAPSTTVQDHQSAERTTGNSNPE